MINVALANRNKDWAFCMRDGMLQKGGLAINCVSRCMLAWACYLRILLSYSFYYCARKELVKKSITSIYVVVVYLFEDI